MATYSKIPLSGSTNGRGVPVAATATPGTVVHTAVTGTTDLDEIWIYVANETATDIITVVEFGGTTEAEDTITFNAPAESGLQLVIPGFVLNNGLAVRVFAAAAGVVVHGFVNRITA